MSFVIELLDLNLFKGERFNTTNHLDMTTHFKTTNTFQYLHSLPPTPGMSSKDLLKVDSYVLTQMHIHSTANSETTYFLETTTRLCR